MLKLRRVNIERSGEIFKGIEKYKQEVINKLNPQKIILFGSFARGDINEGSDVDLIVIANWKEEFLDRIKLLLNLNRFKIPLEPIGYTEEEFKNLVEQETPFILEILKEGKVIYERGGSCGKVLYASHR
jgi:hypothetical protein